MAVDGTGNATAVWTRDRAGVDVVQSRGLDGAGPTLSGLSVPPAAQTGQTLSYSVIAGDVWSPVTSLAWDFGDGTVATGLSVSHAYAAAGTYTATLTATDAVGNATTTTATTTVTSTPPVVPVPTITKLKLTERKIVALSRAVPKSTKLKIGLSTAAKAKFVFKSKHRHQVGDKFRFVRAVLKKSLPAGVSSITVRAKVSGVRLRADTYVITATARNSAGRSAKEKVKLVVVRP